MVGLWDFQEYFIHVVYMLSVRSYATLYPLLTLSALHAPRTDLMHIRVQAQSKIHPA